MTSSIQDWWRHKWIMTSSTVWISTKMIPRVHSKPGKIVLQHRYYWYQRTFPNHEYGVWLEKKFHEKIFCHSSCQGHQWSWVWGWALTTAVIKNLFTQRFSNQTPYSWIRNVLWYEKYLCSNIIFPGLLCTHGTTSVEILTVYDVITHLWRHYSGIDDVIWFN